MGTRRIRSVTRGTLASLIAFALAGSLAPVITTTPARAQTYTLGIDVSHHQGTIDWNRVVDSGHVFAFHKATEGATFTDPNYGRNRADAGAAGIPFGAYHFARPDGGTIAAAQADAISEAEHFLDVAQPAPGDLVPVLDMEATGGLPARRLIAWTQAWLDAIVSALDVQPLIYTSPNFWKTNVDDTTTFADQGFPLWIAHYTSAAAPNVPAANWNGEGWSFWQWTSCATVPGISGCVDEDRFPDSDLSAFIIPGAPEPEPEPEPATPPSNELPPAISGDTEVGETLSASSGTWSGTQPLSYSYSWYRCDEEGAGCSAVFNGTEPTYELVAADYAHRMKVTVTATNSAGSSSQDSSLTEVVTDTTAPAAPRMTKPRRQRTLSSTVKVAWRHPEQGMTFDIRFRSAPKDSGFGDYAELVSATGDTSATIEARTGTTYCFSSRATDEAGNVSEWSSERCTNVPLDDRDLRATSPWVRRSGSRFYLRTFTKTQRRGASLVARKVRVRVIHLVARRCAGCGRVAVLFNGNRVATVGLSAKRTLNKQVIRAAGFGSVRRGTVKIVVISRADPVKIDGLALSIKG
ncbi:MAG: glycoside hydrolase family 25 protein [Actinomycetota bacterium]